VKVGATDPNCRIVIWLDATAPFPNARKTLA
jgi:hypothetical protein